MLKKSLTGIAIMAGLGILAFLVISSPSETKKSFSPPVQSPKESTTNVKPLEGLEFFPDEGQEHVPTGTQVLYKTDPPTSGRHYDKWLPPEVHERGKIKMELAVHNLEHGNIVIYFNPDSLAPADRDAILDLPKKHSGQWDGVVVITDKALPAPLILTAWRAKMPLPAYDVKKIGAFLDAFRGRGPENPIR